MSYPLPKKWKYQVITKAPEGDGNQYDHLCNTKSFVTCKVDVFCLGEIIIVDSFGREIIGAGRKPSKWHVEYKEFTSIKEAVKLANKIKGW